MAAARRPQGDYCRVGDYVWAPACPRPDEAQRLLAEPEGLTRSFVNHLLRLNLLAPDIVEAILDGQQPKAMQLEDLAQALPSRWHKQLPGMASNSWRARKT
jgi:hypothetical protein